MTFREFYKILSGIDPHKLDTPVTAGVYSLRVDLAPDGRPVAILVAPEKPSLVMLGATDDTPPIV